MKFLFFILLVSLIFGENSFAEEMHHHRMEATAPILNKGKKWATDAVMKRNMDQIEKKFHEVEQLIKAKKITDSDYVNFSQLLIDSTQDIINNCKLEPKADETFHTAVLAPMLQAASELKNKDQQKSGLEKVRHALLQYPKYFKTN